MKKEINVSIDETSIEYNIKENNGKIICTAKIETHDKPIKIFYDENVCEIKLDKKYVSLSTSKSEIFIENKHDIIEFEIELNYKYFIKSVYKYLNNFIDKDTLVEEITRFKNSSVGAEYKKELTKLLKEIENENKSIEELIQENTEEDKRLFNLLINNELFLNLCDKMNLQDLMLLITNYIIFPCAPKLKQEVFDDMVEVAINYDCALESLWRLAMTYDNKGYNYNKIEEYFIETKDIWYIGEYISGVNQANQNYIVNLLLATNDEEYIRIASKDTFFMDSLDTKYQNKINDYLNR